MLDFPNRTCYTCQVPTAGNRCTTDGSSRNRHSFITWCEDFENSMSDTLNPRLEQGIAYKLEGRYEEATVEFQAILADEPESLEAYYQLGLVYGFTGLFDESLEALKTAVALDAMRTDVRNDLALTYSMLGYFDEAKAEFEEVLRQDPNNRRALENMQYF